MPVIGNFTAAITAMVESLTDAEKLVMDQTIFQSTFGVSNLSSSHTVMTGVRNGSLVPIIYAGNDYDSMPAGDDTSCDLNDCDLPTVYGTIRWGLGAYNCRVPICMKSFPEDFLIFWNMYRQRLEDPLQEADTQAFLRFLIDRAERRIKGTQWRVAYLGDTDSSNELIKNNDGFFVQALAGNGTKIEVTQADPTGEEIYNYFKEAYESTSGDLWRSESDLVWKSTFAMADKLVTFLNNQSDLSPYNCDCINPDAIVNSRRFSVEGLRIFGIPVEVHREIDGSLNAIASTYKFQALLARKSNLLIGTNTLDKMEQFDIFFDKKDRKIYMDMEVYLGASIPLIDEYVLITNEPFGS